MGEKFFGSSSNVVGDDSLSLSAGCVPRGAQGVLIDRAGGLIATCAHNTLFMIMSGSGHIGSSFTRPKASPGCGPSTCGYQRRDEHATPTSSSKARCAGALSC